MSKILINEYTVNSNHTMPIASCLDWMGHQLTYVPSRLLEQGAKIVRPLKPGFQDQCHTKWREVCVRILRILLTIFLSWSLILGCVGGCMRLIASLARRSFTFISPGVGQKVSPQKIEKIKIRTFNVGMMPEFISVRNGLRPTRERIHEVASAILEKEDDIICLQELFHTEASDYLVEALKEKFPYMVCQVNPRSFGLNSGLMIASRFPIGEVDFWKHRDRGGVEQYANKGAVIVTIQPNPEQVIIVCNTHLNGGAPASPSFPDKGKSYRASQIRQLQDNIEKYLFSSRNGNGNNRACFVVGDFNIGPLAPEEIEEKGECILKGVADKEWPTVKGLMNPFISDDDGSRTSFDVNQDPKTGWDISNLSVWQTKPECLDHIGTFATNEPTLPVELIERSVDNMRGSSDHLAVAATFSLISAS